MIFIPVPPVAKGRPQVVSKGGRTWAITPQKTVIAEKIIKKIISENIDKIPFKCPSNNPIKLDLVFYFEKPKSVKRKYHTIKPDADNLYKLCSDSFNKILYEDDSQIIEVSIKKLYANTPEEVGIFVNIEEIL